MWKLPLHIVAPEYYARYLVPANGHPAAYLLVAWFFVGGYKTAILMAWDRNEAYFKTLSYQFKVWILVPLAPLLRFKSNWYKLPT